MARLASVYLLTHRLEHFSHVISAAGYVLKEAGEQDYGKHWAVIAHFEGDEDVFVCEMVRDVEESFRGYIRPVFVKMFTDELKIGRFSRRVYYLGDVLISAKKLENLCMQNPLNNQHYSLVSRNCQDWVQNLCEDLGLQNNFRIMNCNRLNSENEEEEVYEYEKFAGNHLGLASEDSTTIRIKEFAGRFVEDIFENIF